MILREVYWCLSKIPSFNSIDESFIMKERSRGDESFENPGRDITVCLGIFTPDKTILSRGTSGPTPGDAWPPIIARTLR